MGLIREIGFRGSFLLLNIVTLLWTALLILYYIFIFAHINSVKGWQLSQILILIGTYLMFNSIFKSLVEQNFADFTRLIYRGELDYILTKPVNSQFLISFSRFSLRSLLRFFTGLSLFFWAIIYYKIEVFLPGILVFILSFIIGLVIVYSLWFTTLLLAFHLGNVENLYYLFMPIFQVCETPIDVFPKPAQIIFSFILPLIFVATVPAKALWGNISWQILLFGFTAAPFLLWLSNKLCKLSLKSYDSASS